MKHCWDRGWGWDQLSKESRRQGLGKRIQKSDRIEKKERRDKKDMV